MPQTQQGLRQQFFRLASGKPGSTYDSDFLEAAIASVGPTPGMTINGYILEYAKQQSGYTGNDINGALQAWATATGAYNWSSAGNISTQPIAGVFNFNPDAELDHWNRGANLTGISDSKQGTVSFALTMGTFISTGTRYVVGSVDGGLEPFYVRVQSASRVQIRAGDNLGDLLFLFLGAVGVLPGDGLTHYVCTWDVDPAGANNIIVLRNGVADATPLINDRLADYATATDWSLGAEPDGTLPISMALDNVAFWPGVYEPDTSKFWNGGIVDLGPNGTSSGMPAPPFYFNANYQSLAGINAGQQLGTGGNGSMTGTIT